MKPVIRLLCVLSLLPAVASAETERAREWDAGFHVADYPALSLYGFGGVSMQVVGSTGFGFSGAYNFTDHLAVGLDASWRSPRYRATLVPDGPGSASVISARMDVARFHFKGIYYFLESRLTPFIEAGYGWTSIDSNIVDGPPITGCWWDPWWGYRCQTTYYTYTETEPTYGAAVGLRWESDVIALRGSIGTVNIDRGLALKTSGTDVAQLEILWRF